MEIQENNYWLFAIGYFGVILAIIIIYFNQRLNDSKIKFIIIGILNTINYTLFYAFALWIFNEQYLIASTVGWILSMFISYFLNSLYTYRVGISFKQFFIFPITYLPGFIISIIILTLLVNFGVNDLLAGLLSQIIVIPFSFLIMKYVLTKFKK